MPVARGVAAWHQERIRRVPALAAALFVFVGIWQVALVPAGNDRDSWEVGSRLGRLMQDLLELGRPPSDPERDWVVLLRQ